MRLSNSRLAYKSSFILILPRGLQVPAPKEAVLILHYHPDSKVVSTAHTAEVLLEFALLLAGKPKHFIADVMDISRVSEEGDTFISTAVVRDIAFLLDNSSHHLLGSFVGMFLLGLDLSFF